MHRAKSFFYVCAGICLLALAYHLGASTAQAQLSGGAFVSISGGAALTSTGDVYVAPETGTAAGAYQHWTLAGNIASGAPTPAHVESWGQLKQRYTK